MAVSTNKGAAAIWGDRLQTWRAGGIPVDKLVSLLAVIAVGVVVAKPMLQENADDLDKPVRAEASDSAPFDASLAPPGGETFIGVYSGSPYTYNSDFKVQRRPGDPLMTIKDVEWVGKPFKSPIYYGARVQNWSGQSSLGGMLDFTHSKAYSVREQEVELQGKLDGILEDKTLPAKAKIKDIFHHFEFTHGHNMLTLNGMTRFANPHPRLKPYAGIGFGVSLPHSEVQFKGSKVRTYEYQYVGPAFQFLVGLEFRVPRLSYFFEYKFTYAPYEVPLSNRDGTLLPLDLFSQFQRWWSGKYPEGGYGWTTLVSHQLIGGMGVRIARPAAAP